MTEGVYGPDRRPIAGDITKLPAAHDITREERAIARNVCAVTSALSGCQEIRRQMGHIFQSVGFMHGHGLFITISPNERHSCLTLRLSRFRQLDPLLALSASPDQRRRLSSGGEPSVFLSYEDGFTTDEAVVDLELPGFDFRRKILCRDPLAPVLAFRVAVRLILASLLGLRMCSRCPVCTCCNVFGSNAQPTGGILGLCAALVGGGGKPDIGHIALPRFSFLSKYISVLYNEGHCAGNPR